MKKILTIFTILVLALLIRFGLQNISFTNETKTIQFKGFTPVTPEQQILFGKKIDINIAPHYYLTILPGIGDELARRIIEKRREIGGFSAVSDLMSVTGIGPQKLDKIRHYIDAK